MKHSIPHPALDPKEQFELYKMLGSYEEMYRIMDLESKVLYSKNYYDNDEWHNSNLSLDMEHVAVKMYKLSKILGFFAMWN